MTNHKITNMEVKRRNRNRIFRFLCRSGIVSNPDIAYELKLSLPTVTQNTKELLELGLLLDNGELDSTGGRKARALSVNGNARLAAGLDITRNHIGLLLTNLKGEILKYERIPYSFQKEAEYFQKLNKRLELFLDEARADRENLLGIGISVPGIVDYQKKEITNSHALDITALSFQEIEQYFSFPCHFLNDANAGAYAEGICRNTKKQFFYLSLSNTVGGAFFHDGRLMYGGKFRCGEVGHMTIVPDGRDCYCGKSGCLDSYCSAKRLSDLTEGSLESFFEGLDQGDAVLRLAWEQYVRYLAIAVNNIHMVLDCDMILGGYVGSYLTKYLDQIRKQVSERNTFSEKGDFIQSCRFQTGAAALGAALYVAEEFIEQI